MLGVVRMDETSKLVPINMKEIEIKLAWYLSNNRIVTEREVILESILENIRSMIVDELEGPYWGAEWKVDDKQISVLDILGEEVGIIVPQDGSFIDEFKNNSPKLIDYLNEKVKKIVQNNY
ncbi:hypothetical protein FC80_GL000836 [Liquorilactobacillus cacaonum DSM 21116]|uniref:Uncharacterized protein n=2 Tax=Liquorilactobacillus cacaonum TaxID=483012 RepID=A0A0R2CHR5_9LACO|nr:hypothetical protein FC80_GL000836 [Liquorilactobacillus cacaonum DSM 21116]